MILLKWFFSVSEDVRDQVLWKSSEVILKLECLNKKDKLVVKLFVTPCDLNESIKNVMILCEKRLMQLFASRISTVHIITSTSKLVLKI